MLCGVVTALVLPAWAQDLVPHAYVITPVGLNAVTLTYSFYDGGVNFNGTIPVKDATGTFSVPVFSVYHTFKFFGRSANILAALPYGVGTFQGEFMALRQTPAAEIQL